MMKRADKKLGSLSSGTILLWGNKVVETNRTYGWPLFITIYSI